MKSERIAVYVPDEAVQRARKNGLMNVSAFVREKIDEYNPRVESAKTAPGSTSQGGHR